MSVGGGQPDGARLDQDPPTPHSWPGRGQAEANSSADTAHANQPHRQLRQGRSLGETYVLCGRALQRPSLDEDQYSNVSHNCNVGIICTTQCQRGQATSPQAVSPEHHLVSYLTLGKQLLGKQFPGVKDNPHFLTGSLPCEHLMGENHF